MMYIIFINKYYITYMHNVCRYVLHVVVGVYLQSSPPLDKFFKSNTYYT